MRSPSLLPILTSLALGALLVYWVYSQDTVGVGYTVVRAEEGTPLPIASAVFQFRNQDGVLVSEAGVEAVEPIGWGRIFVDQGDTRTGVALANASLDLLTLNLVLRDDSGLFVAQTNVPLGAQKQLPRFIDELFEDLPPGFRLGSLTIRTQPAQGRVAAVTLRGSPNDHGESIFATLPVVDLDQQASTEAPVGTPSLVFPHIGAGVVSALSTLSTQVILINPSEIETLRGRIRLTGSQGSPLSSMSSFSSQIRVEPTETNSANSMPLLTLVSEFPEIPQESPGFPVYFTTLFTTVCLCTGMKGE